jgi:glycosyltransferase involved in cell wall biosynthesis
LTPTISVVIPYFNAAGWIAATLDSCLQQKGFIKEIIIIDDFSTDNGWLIMSEYQKKYPELIVLRKNNKKGGNNARNFGFGLSTGELIQWLDADDQIAPGKFGAQSAFLGLNEHIDIAYSDWKLDTYDQQGKIVLSEYKQQQPHDDFLEELLLDNWSPPHNYLMKRRLAERLCRKEGWNPETVAGQDREYFTLAAVSGAKFGYVPGCFSIYNRWNKKSVSATKSELKQRSIERILRRFEEDLHRQNWISSRDLSRYQVIINTHKIMLRAAGVPVTIKYGKVTLNNMRWEMVKGFRTTAKVIWEVIKA